MARAHASRRAGGQAPARSRASRAALYLLVPLALAVAAALVVGRSLPARRPHGWGGALPAAVRVPPAPPAPAQAAAHRASTVDPGELPQTDAKPTAHDPAFLARMADLLRAVATGRPALAMPAFFPLAAYLQVKAITDPAADWHDRLVADFAADIETLHAELGPDARAARFVGVSVPEQAAAWIVPGVEYNKGSYWRVYGTQLEYALGGRIGRFTITSLISWRGEWYVVHLGPIR
ncbi:MAG TPA: hypothetical protein VKV23_05910 [Acidimicrobiales bacterium]|nr:hypothetical protein [Acidimicrobiales bacterium]